jgi:hypothetical protein
LISERTAAYPSRSVYGFATDVGRQESQKSALIFVVLPRTP